MSTSGYEMIFVRHVMDIIASMPARLTALSLWKDILPSPTRAVWSVAVAESYVIREPLNGFCPDPGLAYVMSMDRRE
jgi:hypothetical protein